MEMEGWVGYLISVLLPAAAICNIYVAYVSLFSFERERERESNDLA